MGFHISSFSTTFSKKKRKCYVNRRADYHQNITYDLKLKILQKITSGYFLYYFVNSNTLTFEVTWRIFTTLYFQTLTGTITKLPKKPRQTSASYDSFKVTVQDNLHRRKWDWHRMYHSFPFYSVILKYPQH